MVRTSPFSGEQRLTTWYVPSLTPSRSHSAPSQPILESSFEGSFQKLFCSMISRNQSVRTLVKVTALPGISLPGSYPPAPFAIFVVSREVPSTLISTRTRKT